MGIKSFPVPNITIDGQMITTIIRLLFLVSLFLIMGLSISYNKVNRELIFYSERVDNIQNIRVEITALSSALHAINYNLRVASTDKKRESSNRAREEIGKLPALLARLDSLVAGNDPQEYLSKEIGKRIRTMYGLPGSVSPPVETAHMMLPSPGQNDMQGVSKLMTELDELTQRLMKSRMQSRENYKSQIFRYNWLFTLVTIVFMAGTFLLLNRELLRNKNYRVELENKVESLNRSNSELEQFAFSASHDLQEPLRKIVSFTGRILTKHPHEISREVKVLLEKTHGSAERMQHLIRDLLAFSQLVRTGSSRQEVSLNKILREVIGDLSLTIKEKDATITSDDLPKIKGYPSQMVQLFQNLIGNSLKYSRPGVSPAIGISYQVVKGSEIENCMPAHKSLNFHALVFTDNGIGFDMEYADKIFGLFQRLHGREQFEGTGIGLAICMRVISNHNGYIVAKGIRDLGASFSIYLPVTELGSADKPGDQRN